MPLENQSDDNFQSAFTDAMAASTAASQQQAAPQADSAPLQSAGSAAQDAGLQQQAPPQPPQPVPPVGQQPAQPTQAAAPSPPSAFATAAREAGFQTDGLTDEQIAHAMRDHIVRTRPYANYGQQMAPYADQIRTYFEQQGDQGRAQQAAQEPHPKAEDWTEDGYFTEKWSAPKWDDSFTFAIQNGIVQRNAETGLYEAAPGYEGMAMELLPGLNKAAGWTAQQWQGITRGNPYRQFYDVLREPLQRAWKSDIEQMVAEQLARQSTEQRVNSFEQENAAWLYATDQHTGQRILTQRGQEFYDEIDVLRESGVTDPNRLISLAIRRVGPPQQVAAPPQPNLQAAPGQMAQVAPPVPPPVVSPQVANVAQQATFLQNALQRASHSPQAGGASAHAPDHPMSVNENDLNNMFVSEFRNAQGLGPR
jgi:hypothetical protein